MPILTPEERVGTMLAGRYRIESILGHGGTSTVFEAVHTYTNRRVALKLLKPEHARDRELVMRFLTEARTASTLVHPNVVAILDMGVDPQGDVYLAMELVRGEPLGALLQREEVLDSERTLELLTPVMHALALAHERGVIHRDVKPDNILVGDRGDGVVRPILLDFGMAKMVEAAWGHATQSGVLIGTPFYMSPEQAEGASDLDAATDVWSMGVVLYRCLGGALPFFGSSPTSLLLAIVRGAHEPLARRAPDVSPALVQVVERALCVDRGERFADMHAMLAALEDARAGRLMTPAPVPVASPPPRWRLALVATLATGLTLWAIGAWALQPPDTQQDGAEPRAVTATAPTSVSVAGASGGGGDDPPALAAALAAVESDERAPSEVAGDAPQGAPAAAPSRGERTVPDVARERTVPDVAPERTVPDVARERTVPGVAPERTVPGVARVRTVPDVAPERTVPDVAPERPIRGIAPGFRGDEAEATRGAQGRPGLATEW